MKRINLINQRFGKLIVTEMVGKNKWENCLFLCRCDCGNQKVISSGHLRNGRTLSCGCLSSRNKIGFLNFSHGFSRKGHPESFYNRFCTIKARCNNPKNHKWKIYGGRGIKCLWKSFKEFRDDMYESYLDHIKQFGKKNTLIDRINFNGDYFKDNCRWVTFKESARNTRQNVRFEFNGKRHTISEWGEIIGINPKTISNRIYKLGWSIENTLLTPIQ